MSRVRNAMSDKDRTIWFMGIAIAVLGICLMYTVYRISLMPTRIPLHLPPDISQGGLVEPGKLPHATAYSYARYIWQSINTWQVNGSDEYEDLINAFACYVTPEFYEQLQQTVKHKRSKGELSRTRQLSDSHMYEQEYVRKDSNQKFEVWLDQILKETVRGQTVKDISMRYPLYLVADQRPCNVLHYSLAGFIVEPSRL